MVYHLSGNCLIINLTVDVGILRLLVFFIQKALMHILQLNWIINDWTDKNGYHWVEQYFSHNEVIALNLYPLKSFRSY